MTRTTDNTNAITIRQAGGNDQRALERLAAVDSARLGSGPWMVAEVGSEMRAALSTTDGSVIADPFRPTAGLVELLRLHAERSGRPVTALTPRRARRRIPFVARSAAV